MKSLLRTAMLVVLLGFGPGRVFAGSDAKPGVHEAKQTTTFGALGIVAGQTARVSAFRGQDHDPDVQLCSVVLHFFDINGNPQGATTAGLDPGKGALLDLPFANVAPPPSSLRAELNAVVDVVSDSRKGQPACQVATSVEVFDQTSGRTSTSQDLSSQKDETAIIGVGSRAHCFGECNITDASCSVPGTECWVIPGPVYQLGCCFTRP